MEEYKNIPIIDCHVHLGSDLDGANYSEENLLADMKEINVEKAIVFAFNDKNKGKNFSKINKKILNLSRRNKDRIIPFMRLDPNLACKKDFLLNIKNGVKGLKLHPVGQNFDLLDKKALELYKLSEDNSIPILFHTGLSMSNVVEKINKITELFPDLRIILGHSIFVDMEKAFDMLKNKTNIYFDTSTVKGYDLYKILLEIPANQIIFGSDASYYTQKQQLTNLFKYFKKCGITQDEALKILYNNTASLLNIKKIKLQKESKTFDFRQKVRKVLNQTTKNRKYANLQISKIYHIAQLAKNLLNSGNIFRLLNRFHIIITITKERMSKNKRREMKNIQLLSKEVVKITTPYINSKKIMPDNVKSSVNNAILDIMEECI